MSIHLSTQSSPKRRTRFQRKKPAGPGRLVELSVQRNQIDEDQDKSIFDLLEEMEDDIDAVMIATSDHTHAAIAATAITMGKHVYCQKPLTHHVSEARAMRKRSKSSPSWV